MKDNEISNEVEVVDSGKITYANDVVAKIAAIAANEVDGIIGMTGGSIQEMLGMKNLTKGLKVTLSNDSAAVELHVMVKYGTLIHQVCADVQNNIIKAIESMTNLTVTKVDVHVDSIQLPEPEKETEEVEEIEE